MDSQEPLFLDWWSKVNPIELEIFQEGVSLIARLLAARNDTADQAKVISGIYAPIVKHGGRVPESLDFAMVCSEYGVDQAALPEDMRALCVSLNSTVGTTSAAEVLKLSPRQV